MAQNHPPLKTRAQTGAGDFGDGEGRQILGLIDVQVHIQPAFLGQGKKPVQRMGQRVIGAVFAPVECVGHAAQNTAHIGRKIGQGAALIPHPRFHRTDGDTLQVQLARPFRAHAVQGPPMVLRIGQRFTVNMAADRRNPMGMGAGKAEVHSQRQILVRPTWPILGGEGKTAMNRAVRAYAGNGMTTVQMGVHVDEGGPKMAASQIDDPINRGRIAHGEQARNPALFDQNVQKKGAFGIFGGTRHRIGQFGRNPRLGQEQAARDREGEV